MTPQGPGTSCNINMQIDKCLDLTFWWLVIRKPRKHHQLGIAEIWKICVSPDAVNGLWLTFGNTLHVRINLLQPTLPFSYLLRIGLRAVDTVVTNLWKCFWQNLLRCCDRISFLCTLEFGMCSLKCIGQVSSKLFEKTLNLMIVIAV